MVKFAISVVSAQHIAPASPLGVLLGVDSLCKEHTQPDPTIPWLHLAVDSGSPHPYTGAREVYILAKQGKSLRYQLWRLDTVAQSNGQLKEMDPKRRSDGTLYVLPEGGVEAGLAGQVVLLHTQTQTQWADAVSATLLPKRNGIFVPLC